MAGSWNLEWLNLNANRAYPFKEDTRRTDTNGFIVIPDLMIVDMVLVVAGDLSETYHLSKLIYNGSTLTAVIADSSDSVVTSITVDLTSHTTNDGYNLVGIGDHSDARGRIVFGNLSELNLALAEGIYEFNSDDTEFESRAVRPDIRGVRAIRAVQASGASSALINGIVELIAGTNVRLTYVPGDPDGIRIDAISGEGLNEECECDKMFIPPPPIRTINGVHGDENGDIAIEAGESCIEISGTGTGIRIEDTCAKPCCGCIELEFITSTLGVTEASIQTLQERVGLLEQNQINFYNTVLGSLG